MKKILIWFGVIVGLLLVTGVVLFMIYLRPVMQHMKETRIVQYDPALTLILGGGGNSGILTSDSLVLVIDSKMDDAAESLYQTAKQMAGTKPILVVNTHWHPDHSGGNSHYGKDNVMAGGDYTEESWIKESGKESLPGRWLKGRMDFRMGDDTVTLLNLGRTVHTPSDVVAYFHRRKMLFGGDVILNKQAPAILGSADPDAYMWALGWLPTQFDVHTVVPGHGDVGGMEIMENFNQYFKDMKTAASDPSQEEMLVGKYKDWVQVPIVMSPGSTVEAFKRKMVQRAQ